MIYYRATEKNSFHSNEFTKNTNEGKKIIILYIEQNIKKIVFMILMIFVICTAIDCTNIKPIERLKNYNRK